MDLLKGSSNYQKFLDRINEYKQISDKNKAFNTLQDRVESLFNELKSVGDKNFYGYLHLAIIAVSLIMACLSFMGGYFFLGILLISGSIAFKYLYNHTMKMLILDSSKEHKEESAQHAFDLKLYHKMQYMKSGIDVKITRISLVRNAYMTIFPLIMFTAVCLLNLESQISTFVSILMAFVMGTVFWFYFFKDETDQLEYQKMELDTYLEDFVNHIQPQKSKDTHYNAHEIIDLEEPDSLENMENNSKEETIEEVDLVKKSEDGPQLSLGL